MPGGGHPSQAAYAQELRAHPLQVLMPIKGTKGARLRMISILVDFAYAIGAAVVLAGLTWVIRHLAREAWDGEFTENGQTYEEKVVVRRYGAWLRGRSELTYHEGTGKKYAHYKIVGKERNGILIGYFSGTDNSERGSFVMRFFHSGDIYRGKYLLLVDGDQIIPVDYIWQRTAIA